MRLPSSLRIKNSREFARLRAEGKSYPGRYLVLSVLPEAGAESFQFGLITSRKVGGAVVRNKIRRRLREIIRAHQARIVRGCHLVVIARWRSPDADFADLERDWLRLAKRADILTTPPPSS